MNDIVNNELVLKTAKKRVAFKKHFTLFILVNLLLWVIFFFLFKGKEDKTFFNTIFFVLLTWTIVIIGHYFYAIKWNRRMLEKEVENLTKEQLKTQDDTL
ncbi:MAG: 2TM domain-containing protein [Lentimicrobiaceae bacterium]|nr:2TM domain-containing protein [Lentimicrobiaceae bacterium]